MKQARGIVLRLEDGSPAFRCGLREGDAILEVDGVQVHDVLDWRWYADGDVVELTLERSDEAPCTLQIERESGEPWGIEFADPLFDGTMPCCNDCSFCFMKMLPEDARPSLLVRDDDFRLSFIQGNFVTFTNLNDTHVERIIEQHLSPLRFSLHASNPQLRAEMIGPRAERGLQVAERLLEAGITLHAQVVLVPHVNDADALRETLAWAYERPGIANVGIVPVGYTRHQSTFTCGFDTPASALEVINTIEPFRQKALQERNVAWVYVSDEFYRVAYGDQLLQYLPEAQTYGDSDLYEDGIGMVRAFVDDWSACTQLQQQLAEVLDRSNATVLAITGEATREFIDPLIQASPLSGRLLPVHVPNRYFGGNVDVTGLLCACDIVDAVKDAAPRQTQGIRLVALPNTILNADNKTLDDRGLEQLAAQVGGHMLVVSCLPSEYLSQVLDYFSNVKLAEGGGNTA